MSYKGTGRRGASALQESVSKSSSELGGNEGLLIPAPPAGKSIIIHSITTSEGSGKLGTGSNGEGVKIGHLNQGGNSFGRGLIVPHGQPVYTSAQSGNMTVTYSIGGGQPASRITNEATMASQPTTTTVAACSVNVYFSLGSSSVTEGASGTSIHAVQVTRSANCGVTTVDYATSDGSAISTSDYGSTSGTLTFNTGVTSLNIDVTIYGDTSLENDETFDVTLLNQTQTGGTATITGTNPHVVTITNDDTETRFADGTAADWMQPIYYENSGSRSITSGHASNPAAYYSQWNLNPNVDSWCAPTAAACQLAHLNSNGSLVLPDKGGGHKSGISDLLNAGDLDNPDHGISGTKVWDSEMGWGDYLIDGPSVRWCQDCNFPEYDYTGVVIGGCQLSDFGWFMNTNNSSQTSSGPAPSRIPNSSPDVTNLINLSPVGTTIHNVYLGMKDFYRAAGYTDMIGIVYHRPSDGSAISFPSGQQLPNGTPEEPVGILPRNWINTSIPRGSGSGVDEVTTWETIKTEINENRTVIACLQGWNVSLVAYSNAPGFPNTSHAVESLKVGGAPNGIDYYNLGASVASGFDGTPYTCVDCTAPPHWGGTALGHTVLIVGYISAGAIDDVSAERDTDWLIVRDNHESTARNVIVPFKSGDYNTTNTSNVQTMRWLKDTIMATAYADLTQATINIASCP